MSHAPDSIYVVVDKEEKIVIISATQSPMFLFMENNKDKGYQLRKYHNNEYYEIYLPEFGERAYPIEDLELGFKIIDDWEKKLKRQRELAARNTKRENLISVKWHQYLNKNITGDELHAYREEVKKGKHD